MNTINAGLTITHVKTPNADNINAGIKDITMIDHATYVNKPFSNNMFLKALVDAIPRCRTTPRLAVRARRRKRLGQQAPSPADSMESANSRIPICSRVMFRE